MLKKLRKNTAGFTMIEVLIVLAIAGLILLIVFLAVPALQRNSRNTQRKNDVAAALAAVAEFSNNNDGRNANNCTGTNPVTFSSTAIPGGPTSEAKVGYYNLGCASGAATVNGHIGILTAYAPTGPYNTATQDYVSIVPAARCNGNLTNPGSARQWAAVYMIETGSNAFGGLCQES